MPCNGSVNIKTVPCMFVPQVIMHGCVNFATGKFTVLVSTLMISVGVLVPRVHNIV